VGEHPTRCGDLAIRPPHEPNEDLCDRGVVPIVRTHARALPTGSPQGGTAYVDANLCDPVAILASPEVRQALDPTQWPHFR